jgi:2-haloacid dehalogenase
VSVRLEGVRACVFDAYGTLFDVNAAAERCRTDLGGKADALSALWRQRQLQYAWLRSLMGRHADFWQVTGDALDFAMASLGIADAALRARLMDCYRRLDAYPDALPALAAIRRAGLSTAILSNGSPSMLSDAVAAAGLGPSLDAVLSVEDAGIYKPHPSVYRLASDRLRRAPEAICFVSSNGWDAHAAAVFGFQVAWINRAKQPPERLPGAIAAEIGTLAALPSLLGIAP